MKSFTIKYGETVIAENVKAVCPQDALGKHHFDFFEPIYVNGDVAKQCDGNEVWVALPSEGGAK